ncbi:hypothetical protein [Micromonospora sp. NPDC005806]|uniref:Imm32 family immunity protein n=1 Tax=Micromonospora sp. NPDC005806 TaxID=3364234 RepID=UPI003679521E
MKILFYPVSGEIDLSGTADDYQALAALIRAGQGAQAAEPNVTDAFGGTALSQIQVSTTAGSLAQIAVDPDGILRISGSPTPLAVLASNIEAMADDQHGGHLHVDYFPDHAYLAPGSASLIVNSPQGGMPTR